ncbi:MobA/MobL family protein [Luteibacter sahnii]|uniref:MobA/MobL family protein n=1 Tax=Luteibacter sahnii TaxID=3021977 RepID=UPI002A6B6204|nr:MobA/MobL family protein [Luteibacter sp. PPL193]MDY1549579.1 MobA/MobL family protein [Luteibacter sp. PPL193]
MHHARPHLSVHSRSRRHSAVSGAAYRMRLRLFDDRAKRWRDYRPRRHVDRVVFANTIAPAGSPAWATDPALLWNIVEAAEQRKDSQIARDYRIPVPRGVPEATAIDLARLMADFIMTELHTAVSYGVHRDADEDALGADKPEEARGYHVHLYFPTRTIPNELGDETGIPRMGIKLPQFVNQTKGAAFIERMNARWAELANLVAGQNGVSATFDHRSYKRLGIARTPEPRLGQSATWTERRGQRTRLGNLLRAHRATRDGTSTVVPVLAPMTPVDPFAAPQEWPEAVLADERQPQALGVAPDAPVPNEAAPMGDAALTNPPPTVTAARPVDGRSEFGRLDGRLPNRPRPRRSGSSTEWTGPARGAVPGLTREQWEQSPVAYEPLPVVGLAQRFETRYTARQSANATLPPSALLALVHAVERALNTLIRIGRALWHLNDEHKRYSAAQADVQLDVQRKREAAETLQHEVHQGSRPFTPWMTPAHRRKLAEIQTLEEEVAERLRMSAHIDEQLQGIAERADPWRAQVKQARRTLKQRLVALREVDSEAMEDLLGVATNRERPWLKMYSATTEPTLSLQQMVDAAEAEGRRKDRTTKRAYRPRR